MNHGTGTKTTTNAISDRVIDYGASSVSDAQLLGLLLTAVGTNDATAVAEQVLNVAGGLHGLTEQRRDALLEVPGITRRRLAMMFAAREIARREVLATLKDRDVLSSPEAVRRFLKLHLTGKPNEVFCALFLDSNCSYPRALGNWAGTARGPCFRAIGAHL